MYFGYKPHNHLGQEKMNFIYKRCKFALWPIRSTSGKLIWFNRVHIVRIINVRKEFIAKTVIFTPEEYTRFLLTQ